MQVLNSGFLARKWFSFLFFLVFAFAGCKKNYQNERIIVKSISPGKKEEKENLEKNKANINIKENKLKKILKKPKVKIFVGGCNDLCKEPQTAFSNFLKAIAKDPSGKKIIPFLNTAILKFNGKKLGKRWANLFLEGKWKQRDKEIEKFAFEFLEWYRKLDDKGEFLDSAKNGVKIEETSEHATVYFKHPYISGDITSKVWIFRLKPRGLEWLIYEIDQMNGGSNERK